MSRHNIAGDRDVVVGWDPPLDYFFLQEFAVPTEDDEQMEILLEDHMVDTLHELGEVARKVGVDIPPHVAVALMLESA
jgi:hypothetical protein